jgi:hypothetical protein
MSEIMKIGNKVNPKTLSQSSIWWLSTPSESIIRLIDFNYKMQCEIWEKYYYSLFNSLMR